MASIHIPSLEEITEVIKKTMREELLSLEGRITLYDKKSTAKLLGVSEGMVDNLRIRDELKTTLIGSKPMFKYTDILEFLNTRS